MRHVQPLAENVDGWLQNFQHLVCSSLSEVAYIVRLMDMASVPQFIEIMVNRGIFSM